MPISVQAGLRFRKLALPSNRSYGYAFAPMAQPQEPAQGIQPGSVPLGVGQVIELMRMGLTIEVLRHTSCT